MTVSPWRQVAISREKKNPLSNPKRDSSPRTFIKTLNIMYKEILKKNFFCFFQFPKISIFFFGTGQYFETLYLQ